MKKTARKIAFGLALFMVGSIGISVAPQITEVAQESTVISSMAPATAEARKHRHSNSFGRQLQRDLKKNVRHFFDRLFRTYSDSYINGIRDRENIKRSERNKALRRLYAEHYASKYAPAASSYEANFDDYANWIYRVIDTGNWIYVDNVKDRLNLRKVANELDIHVSQRGASMCFASPR